MTLSQFCYRIKKKRKKLGYTMMDMAKLIGVSYGYYNMLENEHRNWTPEMIRKSLTVLGMESDKRQVLTCWLKEQMPIELRKWFDVGWLL